MARTVTRKKEENTNTRVLANQLRSRISQGNSFAALHAEVTQGCLFGLAVADALGAPAGFQSRVEIEARYGAAGITDFVRWSRFPAGSYTKATQLALATLRGCVRAKRQRAHDSDLEYAGFVQDEYERWATLQAEPFYNRVPGITCLEALVEGVRGTLDEPVNDSSENGAVLRMAPVGLVFDSARAFASGVEFAVITHGHPSAYLPAGFIAELIAHLREGRSLLKSIECTLRTLVQYEGHEPTLAKVQFARELAAGRVSAARALPALGLGWTGDEALAMGLFCAIQATQSESDPEQTYRQGVLSAVNHAGQGESPAAVTGAILGTLGGAAAIPAPWRRGVEGATQIRRLAGMFAKG